MDYQKMIHGFMIGIKTKTYQILERIFVSKLQNAILCLISTSKQNLSHNLKFKKILQNSKTYLAKNKFFVVCSYCFSLITQSMLGLKNKNSFPPWCSFIYKPV